MNIPQENSSLINDKFFTFISDEVLPLTSLHSVTFWEDLNQLVEDLMPVNRALLHTRNQMQEKIDAWHQSNRDRPFDANAYKLLLHTIGYWVDEGEDFTLSTDNVDAEIATIAGPQLVVPLKNARFALNAANARWGSLYDALYGTDVIPHKDGLKPCKRHNPARGNHVIAYAKNCLDEIFPLAHGSHKNVTNYMVYYQHLLAFFPDGTDSGLKNPHQFVALCGHKDNPESILLKNNGLHIEIVFDRNGVNGKHDLAKIEDIIVEAAITTIMDCEDSVAAVDAEDKLAVYRNWLGLMQGDLTANFDKGGVTYTRRLNRDKCFTCANGDDYRLPGRALLLNRNVGHLMESDLMTDRNGGCVGEGILDAVVTALIGSVDLNREPKEIKNSRAGSIYIVKPKMHGPEEVAFTCTLFDRVEAMLGLEKNTLKLGIMDEERRTTLNLKACIRAAKARVFFINTGFLDRTGDEIHTSMHAGPFLPKARIKEQPWINAYEHRNVDIGIACGFPGRAQIGKGMWPMPDEMHKMMTQKMEHPLAGANTAWVPSPTAAVLHALHYHSINVREVQAQLANRTRASIDDIVSIPLMSAHMSASAEDIERELENNIQGILGYVVRWVEQGVGCSKVPDINHVGLMEDRATLRISSQHIANWLLHNVCTAQQVNDSLLRMAAVVDSQNKGSIGYEPMAPETESSLAFNAARDLIFKGVDQPNGYTEPLLHHYRLRAKQKANG
ncbi:malate synthase G [Teredinibacter purpureus]|uniref:malate synthase G n=1 Tax=Teredinibacter purpureus TaxID=2731756 RepID=UPI0005F85F9D|nr:malate synthase G [Teredinibacter purpureus]